MELTEKLREVAEERAQRHGACSAGLAAADIRNGSDDNIAGATTNAILAYLKEHYEEVEARVRPFDWKHARGVVRANGDGIFLVTGAVTASMSGYSQSIGRIYAPRIKPTKDELVAKLVEEAERAGGALADAAQAVKEA